ncbi:MAG: SDR family oxidoreductase [Deltaproteobacteria bacterium]|nr:SDR family oxidoreductase [Deltaproteobacteria bacterium]
MEITGKKILITGAAKRIGREIALHLADRGAHVVLHFHRSRKDAVLLQKEIHSRHRYSPPMLSADLSKPKEVLKLAKLAWEKYGPLDGLVNNASTFFPNKIGAGSEAEWAGLFSVNAQAPFLLMDRIGPKMKKRGCGKIINIADWAFLKPAANYLLYTASKAALVSLNQGFARALAPEVQVNAVLPGPILWPTDLNPKIKNSVIEKTLLKRMGSPRDIALAVAFFIEGADFQTGNLMPVEGGAALY